MLNCLVFSRNRPAQLDLLLRTIHKNFSMIHDIDVLYKTTSVQYEQGYEKVWDYNRGLRFGLEMYKELAGFRSQLLAITKLNYYAKYPFIVFFSDDCVVTREISPFADSAWEKELDYKTCGFSLKLGENVTWGYCHNKTIEQPQFYPGHSLLRWKWTVGDPRNDWYYPNSLIATVRRTDWMLDLLDKLDYTSPNWLEGAMNSNRDFNKPEIIAYKNPKVMGIEINRVQDVCPNLCGTNPEHSTEALNQKFLDGYRIKIKNFLDIKSNSQQTHDVNIEWEKA